jgi:hypothetical protein
LYVRKGYDAATPECGPFTADVSLGPGDPCGFFAILGGWTIAPSEPGMTETVVHAYLAPSTQYWAMVRTRDDATPIAQWSVLADDLAHQIPFTTAAFPQTPWVAESVDPASAGSGVGATRLDFDPAGNPALFYVRDGAGRLATWDGGRWLLEPVGAALGGESGYDFGFDPGSGQATIAALIYHGNRYKYSVELFRRTGATADPWAAETVATGYIQGLTLGFNPFDARATVAYPVVRGSSAVVTVAERTGTRWTSQEVVAATIRQCDLAFDAAGDPAVTFFYAPDSSQQVLGFAVRQGPSWPLEVVDPGPGAPFTRMGGSTLAFDPVRGDFAAAAEFSEPFGSPSRYHQLRYCERAQGSWTCTTLAETLDGFGDLSLAFSADGTAHLTYNTYFRARFDAVRPPGGPWTHEAVDWNIDFSADLVIGPDGQPGIAYHGGFDAGTHLVSPPDPVRFARRSPWP